MEFEFAFLFTTSQILISLCLILKKVDTFRNTKLSTLWI